MLRTIARGTLAGMGLTILLAMWDILTARGELFALRTGIVGVTAGGMTLGLAFLMAMTSYFLATRNRAPDWRKRLLFASVWAGAAGMACGFSSATLWLVAGRPWFR